MKKSDVSSYSGWTIKSVLFKLLVNISFSVSQAINAMANFRYTTCFYTVQFTREKFQLRWRGWIFKPSNQRSKFSPKTPPPPPMKGKIWILDKKFLLPVDSFVSQIHNVWRKYLENVESRKQIGKKFVENPNSICMMTVQVKNEEVWMKNHDLIMASTNWIPTWFTHATKMF